MRGFFLDNTFNRMFMTMYTICPDFISLCHQDNCRDFELENMNIRMGGQRDVQSNIRYILV